MSVWRAAQRESLLIRCMKMNKLYVLTLVGEAEMSELTDEEMEKQLLYSPDFYSPLESEVGGVYSERGEESQRMEEEKFRSHALENKIEERVDAYFPVEYTAGMHEGQDYEFDWKGKVESRTLEINVD
jgi:hypothetical protein